ncbi:MAG TPA: hypothetical protein PKC13_30785 [Blastocatellia bacterium]|nr:hypothetical protein [Blastocatellia bacterium]HMY75766.1 hypothetical protein [Blastocatellia bacterium]
MRKTFLFSSLFALGTLLVGCDSETSRNSPTPTTTVTPLMSPTPAGTPLAIIRSITGTQTIENKDGSTTAVTTYSDGSRTEIRTFKNGKLTQVQRDTSATGERTARVVYRADSSEVNVADPNWIEKSMDATGDALAVAARKTKAGVNEVGDKAEDVGDAAKKAGREVGDKAEDVGDAVKKGAKKTGKKIKDAVTPDKKNN